MKKALNHTIQGERGVYNRTEYEDQRRKMLQFWATYIEQLTSTARLYWGDSKGLHERGEAASVAIRMSMFPCVFTRKSNKSGQKEIGHARLELLATM